MSTIGRTYHGPARNYAPTCDVCGVQWLRSEMKRNANGMLVCPDDQPGLVETELDRDNAQASRSLPEPPRRR